MIEIEQRVPATLWERATLGLTVAVALVLRVYYVLHGRMPAVASDAASTRTLVESLVNQRVEAVVLIGQPFRSRRRKVRTATTIAVAFQQVLVFPG